MGGWQAKHPVMHKTGRTTSELSCKNVSECENRGIFPFSISHLFKLSSLCFHIRI